MSKKESYSFFNFIVEIDKLATRDWYSQSDGWACDCGHCRNFLALARDRRLPASALVVLDKLGIPPEKATYVGTMYPDGDKLHYQVSYRIAGNILSGEAERPIQKRSDNARTKYTLMARPTSQSPTSTWNFG